MYGDFKLLDETNEDIFAYRRRLDDCVALVIMNFTAADTEFVLPSPTSADAADLGEKSFGLLVSNYDNASVESSIKPGAKLKLRGYEGRIYFSSH